jgi:hypothetical protein
MPTNKQPVPVLASLQKIPWSCASGSAGSIDLSVPVRYVYIDTGGVPRRHSVPEGVVTYKLLTHESTGFVVVVYDCTRPHYPLDVDVKNYVTESSSMRNAVSRLLWHKSVNQHMPVLTRSHQEPRGFFL